MTTMMTETEPYNPRHLAGIKNLKRVGTIHFTDERPGDYWAEQGYDWFAGL